MARIVVELGALLRRAERRAESVDFNNSCSPARVGVGFRRSRTRGSVNLKRHRKPVMKPPKAPKKKAMTVASICEQRAGEACQTVT